ncbi:hypothetical protein F5883DRAFT_633507 [Diaporthe sp. PMI_573]|nr:hypothetical protein F5883DRAFT_633507 [Diaporthaceae sp. PMI_573]
MQIIAGVAVVVTPLVRDALNFSRAHSNDDLYNHMVRSWLLSAIMIDANDTLRNTVDLEVHAIASLLHDVGLDPHPNSPIITPTRRFEVDGAFAARSFVEGHADAGRWDDHRLQLLWDSIALHSTFGIADYKELEVQYVSYGAVQDFEGPGNGVNGSQFEALLAEYPRGQFAESFNSSIITLCATKPNTTYDTWQQPFGDRYVANYSSKGNDLIDVTIWNPPQRSSTL